MNYLSTTGTYQTDFRQAVLRPLATDGSLFVPERLPVLPAAFINNMRDMTADEIAFAVTNTLLDGEISGEVLRSIARQSFADRVPVVKLKDSLYVAEMFHGPTLSYKDTGARFATGILGHLLADESSKVLGIVSTTGNTGAALAATFRQNMPVGAKLLVLYPSGKMTRAQISQFTTPGNNVLAVEVNGSIANCRTLSTRLVDEISRGSTDVIPLTLNSSNILRVIPQVAVMFNIYSNLMKSVSGVHGFKLLIPSGNMTNLTAAVMAYRMGLPISEIVAVTAEGTTYARAMTTGASPVNKERVNVLKGDCNIKYINVTDSQIGETIRSNVSYTPDPQTAAALYAADALQGGSPMVVLGTAHPAKSLDAMTAITGRAMELPLQLTRFMHNTRPAARIAPSMAALKKYLGSVFSADSIN